ncbi:unnamed protein product [Dicrocoelium dendriticum]|nr:unnamed protein product [Dicrocoelium dendriticum]
MASTSPFAENLFAFEVRNLQNCPIVVDGDDFVQYIYQQVGIVSEFGGECIEFVLRASRLLNTFVHCDIRPIFVFDNLVDTTKNFPVSIKTAFKSIITSADLKQVASDDYIVRTVASLASTLQCLILGSKHQYFFLQPLSDSGRPVHFAPVDLLHPEPVLTTDSGGLEVRFLTAHVFHPRFTDLSRIPTSWYAIVDVFLSSDLFSIPHIPSVDKSCLNTENRFVATIRWLSTSSHDSQTLLTNLVSTHPSSQHATVIRRLAHHMSQLVFDSCAWGHSLTLQLGLQLNQTKELVYTSNPMGSLDRMADSSMNVNLLVLILHGGCYVSRVEDITIGWPTSLANAYRCSRLVPALLAPMYTRSFSRTEFSHLCTSGLIGSLTRPLRVLCYRLIVGLELGLHSEHKLANLNHGLAEEVLLQVDEEECHLPLPRLIFPFGQQCSEHILADLFSLPPSLQTLKPDWLFGLAMTLAIWYHKSPCPEVGVKPTLDRSPFVLAVAASAVANVSNVDLLDKQLSVQYDRLIGLLERECSSIKQRLPFDPFPEHHPEPEQQFTGVLMIYEHLRSVVQLVHSLFPCETDAPLFHFLPSWMLFPSGSIVHYLTMHLELLIPAIRLEQVQHYWLPKLYRGRHSPTKGVGDNLELFDRLLRIASLMLTPDTSFLHPDCSITTSTTVRFRSPNPPPPSASDENPTSNEWTRADKVTASTTNMAADWVRSSVIESRHPLADFSNKASVF